MTLLLSPPATRTVAERSPLTPRGRRAPSSPLGPDSLEDLRDRIERSDYVVDPERVADAMLERLRRG